MSVGLDVRGVVFINDSQSRKDIEATNTRTLSHVHVDEVINLLDLRIYKYQRNSDINRQVSKTLLCNI